MKLTYSVVVLLVGCSGGMSKPGADAAADSAQDVAGDALPPGCVDGVITPGGSCSAGTACPSYPSATCDCIGGAWHCRFGACTTILGFGYPQGACAYIDAVPAGCACTESFNPNQGHTYCNCDYIGDAGTGAD